MDTYSVFREIADSWGLLGMMLFFIGAVLMLFRPSAWKQHLDASHIPFRNDPDKAICDGGCANCKRALEDSK